VQFIPCILWLLVLCVGIAPARSADCAQLNNLLGVPDLKTLATGPLQAKSVEQSKIAPARVALEGVGVQCVVRITDRQGYECARPFKETNNEKLVRAVTNFAASWRPCLAGWKEDYFAELKYTGFVGFTFTKGDKKIVFYTLGGEMVFAFSDRIAD